MRTIDRYPIRLTFLVCCARYNENVRTPLPLRRWTINLLSGLSLLIFLLAMGNRMLSRLFFG